MVYTNHTGLITFGDCKDTSPFGIRFITASDWRERHDYKDLRNKHAGLVDSIRHDFVSNCILASSASMNWHVVIISRMPKKDHEMKEASNVPSNKLYA